MDQALTLLSIIHVSSMNYISSEAKLSIFYFIAVVFIIIFACLALRSSPNLD